MALTLSRKRKLKYPPVSLGGIQQEYFLPLPWAVYPNHYGTFFVFGKSPDGPFFFCDCARPALENLIDLNRRFKRSNNANPLRMAVLDSLHVPDLVASAALKSPEEPFRSFSFSPKLCHRCTGHPPSLRFCHEMYGDPFKQGFGWYINLASLSKGVSPWAPHHFIERVCPSDVRTDIDAYLKVWEQVAALDKIDRSSPEFKRWLELRKELRKCRGDIERHFVSDAREYFGFKRVGDGWVSETLLYTLVRELLPDHRIQRHFRPEWLEGLELDIFLPDVMLGIEYQGEQHASPIEIFGGAGGHAALKERDARKEALQVGGGSVVRSMVRRTRHARSNHRPSRQRWNTTGVTPRYIKIEGLSNHFELSLSG